MDAVESAGAKYVVINPKHHDGFCLWPTQYAEPGYLPYSIERTDWYVNNGNPDVIGILSDEIRARGMKVVFYFSIWDQTHEERSGTDETTDAQAYIDMTKAQLTELLTNYGDIQAVWFDGWKWAVGYEEIQPVEIRELIRDLSPNTLFIDNNHEHTLLQTQIDVYEAPSEGSVPSGNPHPAEEIDKVYSENVWRWYEGYDQSADALRSVEVINNNIANANNNNASYLLAIGPDKSCTLPPAQIDLLQGIIVP